MKPPPNLLILDDLLEPVREAKYRLQHIVKGSPTADDASLQSEVVRHGLFVLAVATVETSLADVHAYYLSEFPVKQKDSLRPSLDDLQRGKGVAPSVFRHVGELLYRGLREYLALFCRDLSIDINTLASVDDLIEVKATRNLLLHNNLRVNEAYTKTAGPAARSRQIGSRLRVDPNYLRSSLDALCTFLDALRASLEAKYQGHEYTRAGAFRRLWDWAFTRSDDTISPMCRFDDYWRVEPDGTGIHAVSNEHSKMMSHSERMFFWVFRTHYNDSATDLSRGFSLIHLDTEHCDRLMHIMQVILKLRLHAGDFSHQEREVKDCP